ncbi:MAG: histidine phosphatase family protein [Bernardetiaceae bacterium]|jgi:broad specificity phosphatase PhoE|nr:histidine phosphatase family protein [Bernardetiaceae bacterium]
MKPHRIILIRHGESEGNVSKAVYGQKPDYVLELTETGRQQARQVGQQLAGLLGGETAFFYVSPLWRTRSTFELVAGQLAPDQFRWLEEPRIREQEWGHLRTREEGEQVERERDAFGTFYFRIPDGESAADVYDRVSDFFGTLFRDFDKPHYPQNAVLITHGMAIRLFLMRWFHLTVEEFEQLANPRNCEMVVLTRNERGKYELQTQLRKHQVYHPYQRPIQI